MLDLNELVKRAIKYLIEGLVVALAAFAIPKKQLNVEEIIIIALTAAATFSILDVFIPTMGSSARGGAGSPEAQLEAKLNMTLADLRLSVRANNCLESENIQTVRDLVQRTEDTLLEVRNFGDTTLNEVREKLSQYGLHLGMRVPNQPLF